MQRNTPFRKSDPDELFILYLENEDEEPEFKRVDKDDNLKISNDEFVRQELLWAERVHPWFKISYSQILSQIADKQNIEISDASKRYGELRLREKNAGWHYNPYLGVFETIR